MSSQTRVRKPRAGGRPTQGTPPDEMRLPHETPGAMKANNDGTWTGPLPSGGHITVRPVSPLLMQEINRKMEASEPPKPTYEVKTAAGDVEIHDHNEKSLATDEEKAAWVAYQAAHQEWLSERGMLGLHAMILEGYVPDEGYKKDDWVKRRQYLGLPVPDEGPERIIIYFERVVVKATDDIRAASSMIMGLTGEKLTRGLSAGDDLFRHSLEWNTDNGGQPTA